MKALTSLLLLLSMSALSTLHAAVWKVGEPFPALTLPTVGGEDSFSLAKFRGKKVMLHVFASW